MLNKEKYNNNNNNNNNDDDDNTNTTTTNNNNDNDNNKVTNWISAWVSLEKSKPFDSSIPPIVTNLAFGRVNI